MPARTSLTVALAAALALAALPTAAQPVSQPFSLSQRIHTLPHIRLGETAWADIDGDGDADALVAGEAVYSGGALAGIYRNDGVEVITGSPDSLRFTNITPAMLPACFGRVAWGDYDGDGDPDAAVQGSATCDYPYQPATRIYRNDGGAFTPLPDALLGAHSGGVAWSDYDGDGDLDLLVFGQDASDAPATALYRNTSGRFTRDEGNPLLPYAFGDALWEDFDRDGDPDLVMIGATPLGTRFSVFVNQGGQLAEDDSAQLFGGSGPTARGLFSSLSAGDADSDGDVDLIITGGAFGGTLMVGETRVRLNGFGGASALEVGVFAGDATWGDFDSDGRADLYVHGATGVREGRRAVLYRTMAADPVATYLAGGIFGSATWTDLEGDGDLDLVATGQAAGATSRTGITFTNLYENVRLIPPPVPSAPSGLRAQQDGAAVTLTWAPDAAATTADWSYDVEVRPTGGGAATLAAHADAEGRRTVYARGNAGASNQRVLRGLAPGTYTWRVQTLTPGLVASAFSAPATFHVAATSTATEAAGESLPARLDLEAAYPNPSSTSDAVTLTIALPEAAIVSLGLYDVLGRRVATLAEGPRPAGRHPVRWDGQSAGGGVLGAGLYYAVLDVGGARHVTTVTRLR